MNGEWKAWGKLKTSQKVKPYLFLMPILLLAAVFVYYPFFKTFLYSFSVVNAKGEITGWAGLQNFTYLFSRREFKAAIQNTIRLALINVPVTVILTMGMALLCTRRRRISPIAETMFALPMAVAMPAIALVFKVWLNPTVGIVNHVLGIDWGWFRDKNTAMYGILMMTVWMGTGFNFLLFLSAFRGIPERLIEAARMDGAGPVAILFHVKLPMIAPTLLYVICTNTVQAVMTSGPIMILTQGGPAYSTTTLIYMMYKSGYGSSNYSLAACISLITLAISLGFTITAFAVDRKRGNDQ